MKAKNNKSIRYLAAVLIFCCCLGCSAPGRFATRKYLPGHFSGDAQRCTQVNAGADHNGDQNEKRAKDMAGFLFHPAAIEATGVTASVQTVPVGKYKKTEKAIVACRSLNLPAPSHYNYKTSSKSKVADAHTRDLETASKHALHFGIFALAFTLWPYTLIFFLSPEAALFSLLGSMIVASVFSILALISARGITKNAEANKQQIKRARQGKAMAVACLVVWLVYVIGFIYLISLL